MTNEKKYITLKKIFWDYNIPSEIFYKIINHQFNEIDKYELNLIIKRMFERLDWYDLLDILGKENIKLILTKEFIKKIRDIELRDKYERIRRILHGEALSISGWNIEDNKRIKPSILSNRWYSSK